MYLCYLVYTTLGERVVIIHWLPIQTSKSTPFRRMYKRGAEKACSPLHTRCRPLQAKPAVPSSCHAEVHRGGGRDWTEACEKGEVQNSRTVDHGERGHASIGEAGLYIKTDRLIADISHFSISDGYLLIYNIPPQSGGRNASISSSRPHCLLSPQARRCISLYLSLPITPLLSSFSHSS